MSRAGTEGDGNVRDIPTRCPKMLRTKRVSDVHFLARHIFLREVRDAARNRRALGETFCRRGKTKMRPAKRQIWSVMANHCSFYRRDVARQRCREIKKRHAGNASNGQSSNR